MVSSSKKFNSVKYVKQRRELLMEEMELVNERNEINKQLRKVRKEMKGWDKYLIHSGGQDGK